MPLNKEAVGKEYPAATMSVAAEATQKYARAYNDDNSAFFDAGRAGGIIAPPMFGVVAIWGSLMGMVSDPNLQVNLLRLVHGEQDMEFLNPIRPGDTITAAAKVQAVETKATGETLTLEVNAKNQSGTPVLKTLFVAFIRSGGARSATEPKPPEPVRGEPILTVSQTIDKDQTYRYAEASGDRNPIHVDENVAKMAGLPGIIVHGLCTMAFTSKVAIDKLCGGDPAKLKRLRVRFSKPVLPGQTITTKIWAEGEKNGRKIYSYETFNQDGAAVIKGGIAEVAP
ncbi:MAG TPA: MaoC/PaaZ C-terminal domain-containing protein [Candidatus Binataceae bacterium]|nr:MaoC/PaaZ C-terminal domain-containing protein [Candidatus Binataceae bacterium]